MTRRDLITALDNWLTQKGSPMAGFADLGVNFAMRDGIAMTLQFAIAQAETQCGTDPNMDQLDLKGHNIWGYGHYPGADHGWLFPDWPNAISSVTNHLANAYVHDGLTTVEDVCVKWVGSYSQSWIDNVSAVMRQFGGDPEKLYRTALDLEGQGTPPAGGTPPSGNVITP